MKKIISAVLAAAMILSMTACSEKGESTASDGSSVVDNAATSASDTESAGTGDSGASDDGAQSEKKLLSNPIPLNAEGDIDMEAALSYQTDFDALKASLDAKTVDPDKPVSENSNENTLKVFEYLRSIYGKQIITAQQMMDKNPYEDIVYYNATGDMPAMKGFDFIFATGGYLSDDMVDEAIEWHQQSGGLVTFTWHWNVPVDVDDHSKGYAFYQEDIVNWSQVNAVTPGTKEYEQVIHDIDLIATKMQRLESEGVTVLFRPLHEASGSWFWWGIQDRSTAENEVFQKLWYMIFDRLENHHKLTNIIWVWNGQSKHCMVSPNAYDIAGVDFYASSEDHSAQESQYSKLEGMNADSGKMLALSECGYIPDPADCKEKGVMWLYYMIWNGDFVYETVGNGIVKTDLTGTPSPNPERMTNEMLVEYFGNDVFITHSDLPEFPTGTKAIPEALTTWEYFKNGG
ncbi:MAG: beta-mannanase [Oscillospiraceae bacterium]|nr:beta-mannanase [Oscillospiraceae bacterium]